MREVEAPLHTSAMVNLQEDLAGKKVTIHFRNEKLPPVTGTLVKLAKPRTARRTRHRTATPTRNGSTSCRPPRAGSTSTPADIAMVQTERRATRRSTQRKPVLVLTVDKARQEADRLRQLSDARPGLGAELPRRHHRSEDAVDRDGHRHPQRDGRPRGRRDQADLRLPERRVRQRASRRWPPRTDLDEVLPAKSNAARGRRDDAHPAGSRSSSNNSRLQRRLRRPQLKLGATPAGEGVDLHFESIGKRTLLAGEALSLTVGKAKADYERVVEWTVGTSRDVDAARRRRERGDGRDVGRARLQEPVQVPDDDRAGDGRRERPVQRPAHQLLDQRRRGGPPAHHALAQHPRHQPGAGGRPAQRDASSSTARPTPRSILKGELTMSNHRKQPVKLHIRHARSAASSTRSRATRRMTSARRPCRTSTASTIVAVDRHPAARRGKTPQLQVQRPGVPLTKRIHHRGHREHRERQERGLTTRSQRTPEKDRKSWNSVRARSGGLKPRLLPFSCFLCGLCVLCGSLSFLPFSVLSVSSVVNLPATSPPPAAIASPTCRRRRRAALIDRQRLALRQHPGHGPLDRARPPRPGRRARGAGRASRASCAADRIAAIGLAMPLPAMSGAVPCAGWKTAWRSPMSADGAMPMPPIRPAARSERMSPNMFSVTSTSKRSRPLHQVQRLGVDVGVLACDVGIAGGDLVEDLAEEGEALEDVRLVHAGDLARASGCARGRSLGQAKGELADAADAGAAS